MISWKSNDWLRTQTAFNADSEHGRSVRQALMKYRRYIFENVKVNLSAYFNRSICYTWVTFFKLFGMESNDL